MNPDINPCLVNSSKNSQFYAWFELLFVRTAVIPFQKTSSHQANLKKYNGIWKNRDFEKLKQKYSQKNVVGA